MAERLKLAEYQVLFFTKRQQPWLNYVTGKVQIRGYGHALQEQNLPSPYAGIQSCFSRWIVKVSYSFSDKTQTYLLFKESTMTRHCESSQTRENPSFPESYCTVREGPAAEANLMAKYYLMAPSHSQRFYSRRFAPIVVVPH